MRIVLSTTSHDHHANNDLLSILDNSLANGRFFFEGGKEEQNKILGRASYECEDEKLRVFIGLMNVVSEISQNMHLVKSYTVRNSLAV